VAGVNAEAVGNVDRQSNSSATSSEEGAEGVAFRQRQRHHPRLETIHDYTPLDPSSSHHNIVEIAPIDDRQVLMRWREIPTCHPGEARLF
jgi:hypothetical protein